MTRVSNFTAGPAALPTPVLEEAQRELLDYQGTGMSIMENSHRSKTFEAVLDEAITLTKEIFAVPAGYQILFMQGGASQQFAMIPMNLLPAGKSADYIITGHWSERALEEANIVGKARVAGNNKASGYMKIMSDAELELDPNAAYVHMTSNNTIYGTEWFHEPAVKTPLICDASSDFMSRKLDISKYAMLYAGAQKNIGPSGLVLAIMRDDLIAQGQKNIPVIFRYETFAKNKSMFNTPPTFAIYLVRGVMRWAKAQGGLEKIEAINVEKANTLYGAIDAAPDYYKAPVDKASRSRMNIVWRLPTEALEDKFVKDAEKAGLVGLKGHRSVGGIRASTYNAVSLADVQKLTGFMSEFRSKNPG